MRTVRTEHSWLQFIVCFVEASCSVRIESLLTVAIRSQETLLKWTDI